MMNHEKERKFMAVSGSQLSHKLSNKLSLSYMNGKCGTNERVIIRKLLQYMILVLLYLEIIENIITVILLTDYENSGN